MLPVSNSKPYFLYVEDDIEDYELLKHVLEGTQFDFEIIHLSNGVEALNFLERSKDFNRLPELIFLDVSLSKMDGKETIVCLRADYDIAKIPIIILSTSSSDTDINYFRPFHVPYIIKPGDVKHFKEEITEVLKGLFAFDVDFTLSRKNTDAA